MDEDESILCPISAPKYQGQLNTRLLGKVKGTQENHWADFFSIKILGTLC
jgi:hypothetical protein